jgi:hypothetical protein
MAQKKMRRLKTGALPETDADVVGMVIMWDR